MTAPVRRRAAAQPVDFYWFQGQSVEKLTGKLTSTPDPILKVRLKNGRMTLEVVAGDGTGHDPINDSRACPPICP